MPDNHALTTPRLRLRATKAQDAAELFPVLDDPGMWTYFPALRPRDAADLERTYARRECGYVGGDGAQVWENWIVRLLDGTPVGEMQATLFEPQRKALVAYGIGRAYRRLGYAREALEATIAHLRDRHGIAKVYAEMDTRNEPSRRLVESLGFTLREERPPEDRGNGIVSAEYVYGLG